MTLITSPFAFEFSLIICDTYWYPISVVRKLFSTYFNKFRAILKKTDLSNMQVKVFRLGKYQCKSLSPFERECGLKKMEVKFKF